MTEITIYCACKTAWTYCQAGDTARASLAEHPTHGRALVTCYHGPACLAHRCGDSPRHDPLDRASGEAAALIDPVEDRDLAWLSAPPSLSAHGVRRVASTAPAIGETLTVLLASGPQSAKVSSLPPRHAGDPLSIIEIQLDCTFTRGDSGSPVIDTEGRVVAVVRDKTGRCGFVSASAAIPSK